MFIRSRLVAFLFAASFVIPCAFVRAEDQAAPEVENAKQNISGVINANAVYVRSGPGESSYPTMKLNNGDSVTIVGMKGDWLKILPPDGSFSYIPKAYVNRTGDGTKGRVNEVKNEVYVKTGSALNEMKTMQQLKLESGNEVEIIDEKDEYYKIKPPAGAFVFVHKQFVTPVKPAEAPIASGQTAAPAPKEKPTEPAANNSATVGEAANTTESPTTQTAETPTTGSATSVALNTAPTTQSTESADVRFDKLEAEFAEVSKKPIEDQPVPDLLTRYEDLSKSSELPSSLLRVVDLRIAALKVRAETREQFVALHKIQEDSQKRQLALKAEKQELEERIKNGPTMYTAVGTLQMSSLQTGTGGTLYRLTDPATGRTVVYLRTDDTKYTGFLGQFIGVKGDVATDAKLNLKCIAPKSAEVVDPAKVNNTVAAQIIPPSLIPQASTGNP